MGGRQLYQTNSWADPVQARFAPPFVARSGDHLQFSCTFVNETASRLTFGESAQSNDDCAVRLEQAHHVRDWPGGQLPGSPHRAGVGYACEQLVSLSLLAV